MISFDLTKRQIHLREKFHIIAKSQLRPLLSELDRIKPNPMDHQLLEIIGKEHLNSLLIPKEYGGQQVDNVTLAIIMEEIAWGSPDLVSIYMANMHAIKTILIGGTKQQKAEILPLLLDSKGCVVSFCPEEGKGGSDSSSYSTTASEKNDVFVLNGTKKPVMNAGNSAFYMLWANMDDNKGRSGINAFIVPCNSAGITCGPYYDKSGYRNKPVASVSFENVRVPKRYLIGSAGSGYLLLMQTLDWSRAFIGASSVGYARAAIEEAIEYARTRIIKNRPIIHYQGVGFVLADLATQLEAARLLVWKACKLIDALQDHTTESSMAKLFASELAVKATSDGMLILGQKCIDPSSLMGKFQREAELMRIFEGTSQIQKTIIMNQL